MLKILFTLFCFWKKNHLSYESVFEGPQEGECPCTKSVWISKLKKYNRILNERTELNWNRKRKRKLKQNYVEFNGWMMAAGRGERERERERFVGFCCWRCKKDQKALKSDSVNVQNEIVCPNKC